MKFTVALSALLVVLPLATAAAVKPFGSQGGAILNNKGSNTKAAIPTLQPAKVTPKGGKPAAAAPPAKGAAPATNNAAAASSAAATAAASTTSAVAIAASSTAAVAAAATSIAAAASAQDLQSSPTLDPGQIQPGLNQDGQDPPVAGQEKSLTSTNNFINFCALRPDLPLSNGQQILTGSCNPTVMGLIVAKDRMPSAKISNPPNLSAVKTNTTFTFDINIKNMDLGHFTNAQKNFGGAPQQVNAGGILIAHSHIVANLISSVTDTTPADPTIFAFFKGLNDPDVNGVLSADVTGGLPAGTYRACTMNTGANHMPALVAVAQHASLDDCTYFEVTDDGKPSGAIAAAAGGAAASGAAAAGGAAATGAAAAGGAAAGGAAAGGAAAASSAAATNAAAATTAAAAPAKSAAAAAPAKAAPAKAAPAPAKGKKPTFSPPKKSNGRGRGRGRN